MLLVLTHVGNVGMYELTFLRQVGNLPKQFWYRIEHVFLPNSLGDQQRNIRIAVCDVAPRNISFDAL